MRRHSKAFVCVFVKDGVMFEAGVRNAGRGTNLTLAALHLNTRTTLSRGIRKKRFHEIPRFRSEKQRSERKGIALLGMAKNKTLGMTGCEEQTKKKQRKN